jgi:hypothetical protein
MRLFSAATASFIFLAKFAAAAAAPTPYLSTASIKSCNGAKTCSLSFTAAPAGMVLTLTHVSCGIVTSGESGSVVNLVLRTGSAGAGAIGDHLLVGEFIDGSNIQTTANSSTAFYVAAGDEPVIDVTASANILSTSDGGCLVSGTMAK